MVGIGRDRCFQLADHVADVAERQPRREVDLDEFRPGLIEPGSVRADPSAIAGGLEHIPAIQLQRRRTEVGRAAVVAGLEQTRRTCRGVQRGERIDLGRLQGQRIAAVAARDHWRIPERSTQHGHLRLQRVAPSVDATSCPQVVDEPIRADQHPALEREAYQQLRCLSARHPHRPAVARDLERAEQRDPQHVTRVRRSARRHPPSGPRQRIISAPLHSEPMPDDIEDLIRRLIGNDATAPAEILERAKTTSSPLLLVAAAIVSDQPADLLARATANATTTRARQLVALAAAHLADDAELLDALVRDHLSDHPDNILAAWIAAQHTHAG